MSLVNRIDKAWNHLTSFGDRLVSNGRTAIYAISIPLILAWGGREVKAATYYVNLGESIQAVIDDPNVVDKDKVIVAEGRYYENINFSGKNIILRSTDPNNSDTVADTIIDGGQNGSVVTFNSGEDANCVLDGFIITGGYSDGIGGGIHCSSSSPTITNCIIKDNETTFYYTGPHHPPYPRPVGGGGGGIHCNHSNPTITNCEFINNLATYYGGGMYNSYSNPKLINCMFSKNFMSHGWGDGGGMNNLKESNPLLIGCVFNGNSACNGGGMWNANNSNPVMSNCTFSANSAHNGGGMWNGYNGNATLINCIFSGNQTDDVGGGIYNTGTQVTIIHSTFSGNQAAYFHGGIINGWNSNLTTINCIFWGNSDDGGTDESSQIYGGALVINYSCIQGWTGALGGIGNMGNDPCFVSPGYWDPNGTPADANDDFWVDGDYHLKSQGWRWDTQRKVWTWDDLTSRCIDAGNPGSSLENELLSVPYDPNNEFGVNLRVNMGAYGGTEEASMAPYGWALLVDLTNDGVVNLKDFATQAQDWMIIAEQQPGDLNRNNIVNTADLALLTKDWLEKTIWYEP